MIQAVPFLIREWKIPIPSETDETKDRVLIVEFCDSYGSDRLPAINVPSGTYGEEEEKSAARKVFDWGD